MMGGLLLSTAHPLSVRHAPYTIPCPPPFMREAGWRKDGVSSSPPAPLGLRQPPPCRPPLCANQGCRRDNTSTSARAAPPTTSPARPLPSARKPGMHEGIVIPTSLPHSPSSPLQRRVMRHPLPLPLRASRGIRAPERDCTVTMPLHARRVCGAGGM